MVEVESIDFGSANAGLQFATNNVDGVALFDQRGTGAGGHMILSGDVPAVVLEDADVAIEPIPLHGVCHIAGLGIVHGVEKDVFVHASEMTMASSDRFKAAAPPR